MSQHQLAQFDKKITGIKVMALAPSLRALATPRALAAPRATTAQSSRGLLPPRGTELVCGAAVATAACRAYGKRRSKRLDVM